MCSPVCARPALLSHAKTQTAGAVAVRAAAVFARVTPCEDNARPPVTPRGAAPCECTRTATDRGNTVRGPRDHGTALLRSARPAPQHSMQHAHMPARCDCAISRPPTPPSASPIPHRRRACTHTSPNSPGHLPCRSRARHVWNHFKYSVRSSQSSSGPAGGASDGCGPGPPVFDYRGRGTPSHCLGRIHPYVRSCSATGTDRERSCWRT